MKTEETAVKSGKIVKIDDSDKKLLSLLELNGRESFKNLARRLGVSQGTAKYRLKRLEETGVISGYLVVPDVSAIGYSYFKLFANFSSPSSAAQKQFTEWVKARKTVAWFSRLDGPYSIGISFLAKNSSDAQKELDELFEKWGDHLSNRKIVVNLKGAYLVPRLFGSSEKTQAVGYASTHSDTPIKLDEPAKALLYQLTLNPRAPTTELARLSHLTSDTALLRMKWLREKGILQGIVVRVDSRKIGQFHYKVLLSLRNNKPSKRNEIFDFLTETPRVTYVIQTMGDWEIEFDVEVESPEHFRKFMDSMRSKFGRDIEEYTPLYVYEVVKYQLYAV
ncbi:TPA: Lrp/AsnC family transcriptional regulator [Candidatus Micrarchaeota archaeon]|nr:Lrp/AsnC family transcriptional regulator [Candidatus Micrarchaeota archaeon]